MAVRHERTAYVCEKCYKDKRPYRIFTLEGEPVPKCPEHGKMTRESNHPYRKSASAKK